MASHLVLYQGRMLSSCRSYQFSPYTFEVADTNLYRIQRVSDSKSQDLANTAWAFAKVSRTDASLFAALAKAAAWRIGEFNPQNLANMA